MTTTPDLETIDMDSVIPNGHGPEMHGEVVSTKVNQIVAPEPPISESAALINVIQRAATDPNVDIDKMERLFEMHQRIADRQSVEAYNAAMSAAQAEMPAVVKNRKNSQTNSRYADLYAITEVAMPIIHKHGFGLSFSEAPATKEGCMGVACCATHSAGHSKDYHFNVPLDGTGLKGNANKTDTHAYGSTFTYGRRYATCGIFNIAIADSDGNPPGDKGAITDEQQEELKKLCADAEIEIAAFLGHYGHTAFNEFPADAFKKVKGHLEARATAMVAKRRRAKAEQESETA